MIWNIVQAIKEALCSECIKERDVLRRRCNDLQAMCVELTNRIRELKEELSKKNEEIKMLKQLVLEEEHVEPPEWLDLSKSSYQPKREILRKDGKVERVSYKPCDLYVVTPTIKKIVLDNKWYLLSHDKKLMKIWAYVIKRVKYQYDFLEDWRYAIITNNYRKGDCEDGTILFITLCRAAGIPANKVFNACGWYYTSSGRFGHSFPIAQMSDGKWYVFESTLDFVPSKPKLFKGSNYSADWGVHNWMFDGKIKPEYKVNGRYQV